MVSRSGQVRWCGPQDGLPEGAVGRAVARDNNGYPVAVVTVTTGTYPDYLTDGFLCSWDGSAWVTAPLPFDYVQYFMIRCMVVDIRGHIWFGTFFNGALEFDGSALTNYTSENSPLAGDNVYDMQLDSTGRLWFCCPALVAGHGGLCYYDGQSWGAVPGLEFPDITGLAFNLDGTMFVGSTHGLYVMEQGQLPRVLRTEEPDVDYSGEIAWDNDGNIYLTHSQEGVWRCRRGERNLITTLDGLATDATTDIEFDSRGVGWIASPCGVTRWEGDTFTTFTTADGLATDAVRSIKIDPKDQVWVIAGSICQYDGSSWRQHLAESGAPEAPRAMDIDTRAWVWASSYSQDTGSSLFSYDGQAWRHWTEEDGLRGFDTGMGLLYCDWHGNVIVTCGKDFFGHYNLGVFDGSSWSYYPYDEWLFYLAADCARRIWFNIYYYGGIVVWDLGDQRRPLTVENADISNKYFTKMFSDRAGDIYGVCAPGIECHRLNPNVVALASKTAVAPGDTLSIFYWAENPGGADRELDLWVSITMPTGDVLYLPTLWHEPTPATSLTITKETTLLPTEVFSVTIPDTLAQGEYIITPWFTDRGATGQTGQNTPVPITIASAPIVDLGLAP